MHQYREQGYTLKPPEEETTKRGPMALIEDVEFRKYLLAKLVEWRFETLQWRIERIDEDWEAKISRWTLSNYYKKLKISKLTPGHIINHGYNEFQMVRW